MKLLQFYKTPIRKVSNLKEFVGKKQTAVPYEKDSFVLWMNYYRNYSKKERLL